MFSPGKRRELQVTSVVHVGVCRRAVLAAMGIVCLVSASAVPAAAQAGWYVLPSLRLTEEYDDNVFGSADATGDVVSRITGDVKGGYKSKPFTLLLQGSADEELFVKNPDLNGFNRVQGGLDAEWIPTDPLVLRLTSVFTKTRTPSELTPTLGLELGRQDSTQLIITPSAVYRFDARTSGDVTYTYSTSDSGDITTVAHEPRLRLSNRLTHVDVGSIAYGFRSIDSGGSSSTSHLALLGWSRQLSKTTGFTLEAGPRFSDIVDAEVNAVLRHQINGIASASVGYTRTSTPITGRAGVADAQAVTARFLVEPMRSLRLSAGAVVSEVKADTGDTMSQGVELTASYRLMKWLSAFGRYRFNRSSSEGPTIYHNVISIGVDLSYPLRVDD